LFLGLKPKLKYVLGNCKQGIKVGLRGYIIKRIIYTVILILGVITLNFFIFEAIPGNPLENYINRPNITQETIAKLRDAFGIGKPWYVKYPTYVKSMLTFNFGQASTQMGSAKVVDLIMQGLGNTLLLLGASSIIAVVVGILIGAYAAHERGKAVDGLIVVTSLATFALPTFWMGLIFQAIFSFWLKWLPAMGWFTNTLTGPIANPFYYWLDRLSYIVLPGAVLFLFTYGGFVLLTRACVLETMTEDYVLTARAKGVRERTVLFKHILRNASLPIITNVAIQFGFLLSGAIITERVFQYNGLGTLIFNAIGVREVPVMQAIFYIIALCVIVANFIADISYGLLDPRVKYG
jgi:peptide/nickel transport system permease protein